MDATTGINAARQSIADPNNAASMEKLDTDAFLKLMIAQLQNQDPLDPTDNNELLQQVNEIRNIGATDKLTETLNAVLLGQNLASSTALIGRKIEAAGANQEQIKGVVSRVTVAGGVPKLLVGEKEVSLSNVINIAPAE